MRVEECIKKYIEELEGEVMKILSDPKTDKKTKNLAMKPLVSRKKILQNTLEALELVERVHQEEIQKAGR